MADAFESVWPSGLERTLWKYDQLKPEQAKEYPFAGLVIEPGFAAAFVFGALVVAFFAWRRLQERTFDPGKVDYKVLVELNPTELRGRSLMLRAYGLYTFALMLIYTGLTFFGSLIVELLNQFPVAGLQVDAGRFEFDQPSWPLLISFGFAGFLPMLKPLEALEGALRRAAHQFVGIPTKIRQRTERIITQLRPLADTVESTRKDRSERDQITDAGAFEVDVIPRWILTHLEDIHSIKRILEVREEIRFFVKWSNSEKGYWPRTAVRDEMRRLEDQAVSEAVAAMREFDRLVAQDYENVALPSKSGDSGIGPLRNVDKAVALQVHQKSLQSALSTNVDDLVRLNSELASILAVYSERDPDFEKVHDRELRELLYTAVPIRDESSGPELGIALALLPILFVYAMAVSLEFHGLIGTVELSAMTSFVTALLETTRLWIVFWLPMAAVLGWRQYRVDGTDWYTERTVRSESSGKVVKTNRSIKWSNIAISLIIAGVVSITFLTLFGIFQMTLIADNVDRLNQLIWGNNSSNIWYFTSQFFASCVFALFILMAIEISAGPMNSTFWVPLILSIIASACVCLAMMAHLYFWYFPYYCSGVLVEHEHWGNLQAFNEFIWRFVHPTPPVSDEPDPFYCARYFGQLDFVFYLLIPLVATFRTYLRNVDQRRASEIGRAQRALTAGCVLVACALALLQAGEARAQPTAGPQEEVTRGDENEGEDDDTVRVGFRADAEPFSYIVDDGNVALEGVTRGENRIFKGYLADLCYEIFSPGDYEVESVEITAADRFDRLRPVSNGAEPEDGVDVLCDPVTIRYREQSGTDTETGRSKGIYSPIVFVSGVSYIKTASAAGDVGLGYVKGTTSQVVAERACRVDLFGVFRLNRSRGQQVDPVDDCTLPAEDEECRLRSRDAEPAPNKGPKPAHYIFCPLETHSELIDWLCSEPEEGDDRQERVYFGDRDIILGKLGSFGEKKGPCAGGSIEANQPVYTYEPYALVITKEDPELVRYVQRRVYDFFSHKSRALGHFSGFFPQQQMSEPLAYLFLLNAVDPENLYLNAAESAGPENN